MASKKTTIHDIARELNITASTVSRALKDHPKISDATKSKVVQTARDMNYQPNSIAAALRRGKSNLVGVMVPTIDRNFFGSVVRGIEDIINPSNFNVLICQSNDSLEREKLNIKTLLAAQVDAVFASYAKETQDFGHFQQILDRDIPLILFDRMDESLLVDKIVIDDYLGAFQATEHLIEQGCKRIVHFSGPQHVSIYRDRQRGYQDALNQHNIEAKDDLIIHSNLTLQTGRKLAREITEWTELPDGIFSSSDYAAMGAMEVLKNKNIAIPEQIAIVGFSNEAFTALVEPSLSSVDQHSKQMGQYMAKLFLEIMENKEEHTPSKTMLRPELIIRSSSLRKQNIN